MKNTKVVTMEYEEQLRTRSSKIKELVAPPDAFRGLAGHANSFMALDIEHEGKLSSYWFENPSLLGTGLEDFLNEDVIRPTGPERFDSLCLLLAVVHDVHNQDNHWSKRICFDFKKSDTVEANFAKVLWSNIRGARDRRDANGNGVNEQEHWLNVIDAAIVEVEESIASQAMGLSVVAKAESTEDRHVGEDWQPVTEVAAYVNRTPGRITQLCNEGKIIHRGKGRCRKVNKTAALLYFAEQDKSRKEKKERNIGRDYIKDMAGIE